MKCLVLVAPSLLLLCFAVVLSKEPVHRPETLTAAQRIAEIRELHAELDKTSAKLSVLEVRNFRPR